MPNRVIRNHEFLKQLHSCKRGQRKKLLKAASKDNIDALSEVALNTLIGNIPLKSDDIRKLKRHREKIRQLAHHRTSSKKKKILLVQQGGFLPLLLTPLLAALGGLAAKAIGSAVGL
jgi:hypothetical protein